MVSKKYTIYCDGSTRANGQADAVGGWAYLVSIQEFGEPYQFIGVGSAEGTTNQRMELTAAINALDKIVDELCPFDQVEVYTDSAYLHNCYKQKWYLNWQMNGWKNSKKQPVANQDLWEKLIPYFEAPNIEFLKVKGHADNELNNYVDELAQKASARHKENGI